VILYNVTIGPNSIVGAGSVVNRDVPPDTVVSGVPAQVISGTQHFKQKCVEQWEKLHLTGDRSTWEKQLRNYFWPTHKEG
jgi:serine acetyltransferase